jgi:leucyl-tRNA synthetase
LTAINQSEIKWPTIAKEELEEENINFVIQINGKKKAVLKVKNNIIEKDLLKEIKENKETEKLLENQKIKKTIFISNRLINIII